MKERLRQPALALLSILLAALPSGAGSAPLQGEGSPPEGEEEGEPLLGHSRHGEGFDEGPRQRPWRLENIGSSHFPITTSLPEVQEWFDQGNTLLHSFWYFEAERAFRWCLKLDPDCAMAWWGLGRAVRGERSEEFFKEAYARKDLVSERERMYLEAWEAAYAPELSGAVEVLDEKGRKQNDILAEELERIAMEHPDDLEAKALVGRYRMRDEGRYGNELIYREILSHAPLHPGAHHYRIHNWDGPEGRYALDSCEVYGELASYSGHANHMPGHIYSGIGMWHDAAYWMDRATRVEKHYMRERMIFPFNNWNYAHNRNYLSYIQEQLGMAERALDGARQLLAAPLDPKYNDRDKGFTVFGQGLYALSRGLVKFERWDVVLDGETIPWRDTAEDKLWRSYFEGLALLGEQDLDGAIQKLIELKELEQEGGGDRYHKSLLLKELQGLVAIERGEVLEGLGLLEEAAAQQLEEFHHRNDPPRHPRIVSNVLGEAHLEQDSFRLAARCFERTLETVKNDGFALSGLARARFAIGDDEGAREAYGRLRFVWSDADPGLRWLSEVYELGLEAEPTDDSPRAQRRYALEELASFGPGTWEPYPAPELDALDADEERVSLEEYRGRNVVLVFYLGGQCAHCIDQLVAIDERVADFDERNTVVLAISGDTPEDNRRSLKMGELGMRLLTDSDFANARRFRSYDDFEEMELHSTIFIDREGRIVWARSGGDPFMDLDFLLEQIDRSNEAAPAVSAVEAASGDEASEEGSGL